MSKPLVAQCHRPTERIVTCVCAVRLALPAAPPPPMPTNRAVTYSAAASIEIQSCVCARGPRPQQAWDPRREQAAWPLASGRTFQEKPGWRAVCKARTVAGPGLRPLPHREASAGERGYLPPTHAAQVLVATFSAAPGSPALAQPCVPPLLRPASTAGRGAVPSPRGAPASWGLPLDPVTPARSSGLDAWLPAARVVEHRLVPSLWLPPRHSALRLTICLLLRTFCKLSS